MCLSVCNQSLITDGLVKNYACQKVADFYQLSKPVKRTYYECDKVENILNCFLTRSLHFSEVCLLGRPFLNSVSQGVIWWMGLIIVKGSER